MSDKRVQLSHGGGGREMAELINKLFFDAFDNPILRREEDAACLPLGGDCAFTTDSFTVAPLFFKGGDIGKLAIAGTVNDLAMMGAEPQYLSCGFIIEEGFEISRLKQIVASMADALSQCGARIVCGDTKVVPKLRRRHFHQYLRGRPHSQAGHFGSCAKKRRCHLAFAGHRPSRRRHPECP